RVDYFGWLTNINSSTKRCIFCDNGRTFSEPYAMRMVFFLQK
ncbi:hypothetical protein ACUXD4_002211, partial [Staphylococcus lugdunensis]